MGPLVPPNKTNGKPWSMETIPVIVGAETIMKLISRQIIFPGLSTIITRFRNQMHASNKSRQTNPRSSIVLYMCIFILVSHESGVTVLNSRASDATLALTG